MTELSKTNDVILGRQLKLEGGQSSSNREQVNENVRLSMSPFYKRMGSYTQGALNRSNLRGPSGSMGNGIQQRPPKLSQQQSASSKMGRRPSNLGTPGLVSPIRNSRQLMSDVDWSADLQVIRAKI